MKTPTRLQLIVHEGQDIQFWSMMKDDDHIQIAFDCGDNGFLVLTNKQAESIGIELITIAAHNRRRSITEIRRDLKEPK